MRQRHLQASCSQSLQGRDDQLGAYEIDVTELGSGFYQFDVHSQEFTGSVVEARRHDGLFMTVIDGKQRTIKLVD